MNSSLQSCISCRIHLCWAWMHSHAGSPGACRSDRYLHAQKKKTKPTKVRKINNERGGKKGRRRGLIISNFMKQHFSNYCLLQDKGKKNHKKKQTLTHIEGLLKKLFQYRRAEKLCVNWVSSPSWWNNSLTPLGICICCVSTLTWSSFSFNLSKRLYRVYWFTISSEIAKKMYPHFRQQKTQNQNALNQNKQNHKRERDIWMLEFKSSYKVYKTI